MNLFVFDIETIPDCDSGRRLLKLEDLPDTEVAELLFKRQRERNGSDFLPLHLHKIVAISVVFRHRDQFKVWSLGETDSAEKELVQRFFDGIEKYSSTLVSWNGSGFDLPVLHYRAMLHGISAPKYWETGEQDPSFRWNNYLNRYHQRHLDIMDVLAGYQARANAPLDEVAAMLGFPGKMGMSGAKVWDAFQAGQIESIRDYCETDVLNTYLVYLRFELMRGQLTEIEYKEELKQVKNRLMESGKAHLEAFHQTCTESNLAPNG